MTEKSSLARVSTGIHGLDEILQGGLLSQYAYLVRGEPGTGKTITGLHFLSQTKANSQRGLFITFDETEEQIKKNARGVGFDTEGLEILDLSPGPEVFSDRGTYDVFEASEVEKNPLEGRIKEKVEGSEFQRVFLDSVTNFRFLAPEEYQFRRQVLSLVEFFRERGITTVFSSEASSNRPDDDLQFLADGVITLKRDGRNRTLEVEKFRGSNHLSGPHSFSIGEGGINLFPKVRLEQPGKVKLGKKTLSFGIPEVDKLLKGGLEETTVSLLTGPSGVGKTNLGCQFLKEAAERGQRSVLFLFEEEPEVLIRRSESINIPIKDMLEKHTLKLERIDPLNVNSNQFANIVKDEVEKDGADIVMIDSVDGYRLGLQGDDLAKELYSLTNYLKEKGVTTILTSEVSQVTGDFKLTDLGISFLVDNVIFLRQLEQRGKLKKAIGVFKKRLSDFENSLREFEITEGGIKVGKPLTGLRGVLTGQPDWEGKNGDEEE